MASALQRCGLNLVRRSASLSFARPMCKLLPDSMEHATGLEKREMMAIAQGNENPFDLRVLKRGAGTKDNPNLIPSVFDKRMIGCICEEDSTNVVYMWLEKGAAKRCECGHYFKLVDAKPV